MGKLSQAVWDWRQACILAGIRESVDEAPTYPMMWPTFQEMRGGPMPDSAVIKVLGMCERAVFIERRYRSDGCHYKITDAGRAWLDTYEAQHGKFFDDENLIVEVMPRPPTAGPETLCGACGGGEG